MKSALLFIRKSSNISNFTGSKFSFSDWLQLTAVTFLEVRGQRSACDWRRSIPFSHESYFVTLCQLLRNSAKLVLSTIRGKDVMYKIQRPFDRISKHWEERSKFEKWYF